MISPAGAALWIAGAPGRFDVPAIPARKRQPIRAGGPRHEHDLRLLIRSGLGEVIRSGPRHRSGSAEACRQAATARLPPTPKVQVALRLPAQERSGIGNCFRPVAAANAEKHAGNDAGAWRSSYRFKLLYLEGDVPLHGYGGRRPTSNGGLLLRSTVGECRQPGLTSSM